MCAIRPQEVRTAVKQCLERWKQQRPNDPFRPLDTNRPGQRQQTDHFAELYQMVCRQLNLPNPPAGVDLVAVCAALASLTEDDLWPTHRAAAGPTQLDNATRTVFQLAKANPVKGVSPLAGIFQITLAWLNGWGRDRVRFQSRRWDGIPKPAQREMVQYLQETVTICLNWIEGNPNPNNPYPQARVVGFPQGQSPRKWAVRIYHRLIAKAPFVQCRCFERVDNAGNRSRKARFCRTFHNLAPWDPQKICLPHNLQTAVKGKFGDIKAAALNSGLLMECLRTEFEIKMAQVAVWRCHCQARSEPAIYLDHCPTCGRSYDESRHKREVRDELILAGPQSSFQPRKMWQCADSGCQNWFAATKLDAQGRPDPAASDCCPLKNCQMRHGRKWATVHVYQPPLPADGVPPWADQDERQAETPEEQRRAECLGNVLKKATGQGFPVDVLRVLEAALNALMRDPGSDLLRRLLDENRDNRLAALRKIQPDLLRRLLDENRANRLAALREIPATVLLDEWDRYRPKIVAIVRTELQPPETPHQIRRAGKPEDEDRWADEPEDKD